MSEMMLELTLSFSAIDCVTVTLTNRSPISIPFTSPMTKADWEDMQWYIESYPVQYAADVDDLRAERIVAKLKVWGQGLFNAVFSDRSAERLFNEFQDAEGEGRQITIAASQPEILRLPWELLCDPRAEAQAVLQAIEQTAPDWVVVEFLRPATLKTAMMGQGEDALGCVAAQYVRINQEQILKGKRIKHRNFGNYSKHDCPYNGVMIRQGGFLTESTIRFDSDNHRWARQLKARRESVENRNFRDNQTERSDRLATD